MGIWEASPARSDLQCIVGHSDYDQENSVHQRKEVVAQATLGAESNDRQRTAARADQIL